MIQPSALRFLRRVNGPPGAPRACGAVGARKIGATIVCNLLPPADDPVVRKERAGHWRVRSTGGVSRCEIGMRPAGGKVAVDAKIAATILCNVRAVRAGRRHGRLTGGASRRREVGMRPLGVIATDAKIATAIVHSVRALHAGRRHARPRRAARRGARSGRVRPGK